MPRIWSRMRSLLASEIVTTRITDALPMTRPRAVRNVLRGLASRESRLKRMAPEKFIGLSVTASEEAWCNGLGAALPGQPHALAWGCCAVKARDLTHPPRAGAVRLRLSADLPAKGPRPGTSRAISALRADRAFASPARSPWQTTRADCSESPALLWRRPHRSLVCAPG